MQTPPSAIGIASPSQAIQPIVEIPYVPAPPKEEVKINSKAKNFTFSGLEYIQSAYRRLRMPKDVEKKDVKEYVKLQNMGPKTQQFQFYPSLEIKKPIKEEFCVLTESELDTVKHLSKEQTLKKSEQFKDISILQGDELILPTEHDLLRIQRIHKLD